MDGPHRSGRAGGNHQDAPTTLLLPGRKAHPLSSPPHPASATGLALAKPVQQRTGQTTHPAAPLLTAAPLPSGSSSRLPNPLTDWRQVGPDCLLLPTAPMISPSYVTSRPQHPPSVAVRPRSRANLSRSNPHCPVPSPLIPDLTSLAVSLRWIGA